MVEIIILVIPNMLQISLYKCVLNYNMMEHIHIP